MVADFNRYCVASDNITNLVVAFSSFVLSLVKRANWCVVVRCVVMMEPCRLVYIEGLACYRVVSIATMKQRNNTSHDNAPIR